MGRVTGKQGVHDSGGVTEVRRRTRDVSDGGGGRSRLGLEATGRVAGGRGVGGGGGGTGAHDGGRGRRRGEDVSWEKLPWVSGYHV
jgi:hypothetical protein